MSVTLFASARNTVAPTPGSSPAALGIELVGRRLLDAEDQRLRHERV
jgi:hypothetical protein